MPRADVLVIAHQFLPSDPRVSRQLDALAEAGFEGDVICLRGAGEARRDEYRGFRLHRLPVGHKRSSGLSSYVVEYGMFFTLALLKAAQLSIRGRHPVVITHTLPDVLVYSALVPKLLGARVVMDMHEYTPELYRTRFGVAEKHPLIRAMGALEQMSIAFADAVITVHEPGIDLLTGRGAARGRIGVTMNTAVMTDDVPRREARPTGPFTLVYHGTLVNQYDLHCALDAMEILIARGSDVQLRIVGDGPERESLAARVSRAPLAGRVSLEPPMPLDRIPELLQECDAGLISMRDVPYAHVALPMKAMECVAAGLPVIINGTGVMRHYFDDQSMAFVPFGDARAIADVVDELRVDAGRRATMAARAHRAIWPRRLQVEGRRLIDILGAEWKA